MSQPHNSTDTQSLLQSMLQRLKLQPGREGQALLHTPAASTWGQDGGIGASNLQQINNGPENSIAFGTNGIPSKDFGISAAGKDGEIPQRGHGCEVDEHLISFPSQKHKSDDDTSPNGVLGQVTSPGIAPTGTGWLFPAKSLKDADSTSFYRTDMERVSFGNSAMTNPVPRVTLTSMGQNQEQNEAFKSKVYMWSLKCTDVNLDTGSQENKMLHMGNGDLAQNTGIQFVASSQKTTNSNSRRQRSSENKTRRWTQKIRERWRDRSGSKKGKEGAIMYQKSQQVPETSPQNQLLTAENTFSKEAQETLSALDNSDPSKIPPAHTDNSTLEGRFRSYSDSEFGLGSFSLLEEIVTGQEWAEFLHPNQSEASPVSNFGMAPVSANAFQPASMDVSEGKQQYVREADQLEPMEDGCNQSDVQSGESVLSPPPSLKPADILYMSVLKSQALSRKRQHRSAGRRNKRLQTEESDRKEAQREGSLSITSSHVMDETGESRHDEVIPLYTLNPSPMPLSPSFFNPCAPVPRSVLISQDSEYSVETETKRRRVEDNRRVRFSEEVAIIEPLELELGISDSEEDIGSEEDSVIEQECEQAAVEDVALTRRHALPAWILALKRKNTGKKHT
uniref:uncharacterized protein LOC109956937 n=1 Tax=Monopterus albus TaxID=43700 RepID=UPI0009B4E3D0|nr:uncharacterized protein LOC109956937 [Monopterus albus]